MAKQKSRGSWVGNSLHRGLLVFGLIAAVTQPAWPQEFPTRPVKMVIASTTHECLRGRLPASLVAKVSGSWAHPLELDSLLASQRRDAVEAVAAAPADGHTILLASIDEIVLAPIVRPNLAYDPRRALTPVALVCRSPFLLVTRTQAPFNDVEGLRQFIAANPAMTYAANRETLSQLLGELVARRTGAKLGTTGYRTDYLASMSVAEGITYAAVLDSISTAEWLKKGELKVLRLLSEAEADIGRAKSGRGLPSIGFEFWAALFVPAATPPSIVAEIDRAVGAALGDPQISPRTSQLSAFIENSESWVRWLVQEGRVGRN
jgi:tripartite-type tricarboxylate transporter receptor subunit TctC